MNLVTCCIVFWKRRAVIVSVLDRILKEPARIHVAVCFTFWLVRNYSPEETEGSMATLRLQIVIFLIIKVT